MLFEGFMTLVVAAFGANKGVEYYKKKKYNGNGMDRRRSSMAVGTPVCRFDKDYIGDCFESLEKVIETAFEGLGKDAEIERMKLVETLREVISKESLSTRDLIKDKSA